MRHYPRNIGDLAAATRGLDLLHRGAYDALLDAYYLREAPLPLDRRECYLLADARSPAERRAVDTVLARYFTLEDDGYHQARCDRELARFSEKSEKARASAGTRWADSERNANASETQCERNANASETHGNRNATQDPRPNTQDPKSRECVASAPPASRGSRLVDGWTLPAEWREWARQERPDWDDAHCLLVSLKFRDYWLAQAGQRGRKADWLATWRSWVRNESSRPGGNGRADARETRRSASVADILGAVNHEPKAADDPHDITGESVRVA